MISVKSELKFALFSFQDVELLSGIYQNSGIISKIDDLIM